MIKNDDDVWHIWFSTGPLGGEFKVTVDNMCMVVDPVDPTAGCSVDMAIIVAEMDLPTGASGARVESAKLKLRSGVLVWEVRILYMMGSDLRLAKTRIDPASCMVL